MVERRFLVKPVSKTQTKVLLVSKGTRLIRNKNVFQLEEEGQFSQPLRGFKLVRAKSRQQAIRKFHPKGKLRFTTRKRFEVGFF